MTLLYVCHRVPYPPNKGEKIRAYHHLVHLARRNRIHLACLADTRADVEHAQHLVGLCASVDVVYRSPGVSRLFALAALPTHRSLSVAAFDSPELRRKLERRLHSARPDLVLAYSSPMAQYVEHLRGIPRVLDFVDADSEKWRTYGRVRSFPQSAVYALEADRLAGYEARMAMAFDASIFVSEAEADIVRRRTPGRDLSVIPMGVDQDFYRPVSLPATQCDPRVVFTGDMSYFPNVDAVTHFARDVFPLVQREVPGAEFVIVGRNPAGSVRNLARLPGVSVTGAVPDVRPHLAGAALAVAPFRISRGVQSKVLEAMASGLPVVGTSLAFQGLTATESDGIRVQNSAEPLAGDTVAVLRNPALRCELGRQARRYVERHHRWDAVGERLEKALMGVAESRRPAASGEV